MRTLIAVSVVIVATAAAVGGTQQPQTPPQPASSILGVVVDAQSDKPISGVVVTLNGGPQPATAGPRMPDVRVLTDARGAFGFRNLALGRYMLAATAGGSSNFTPNGFVVSGMGFPIGAYLDGGFGQRRPNGPLQPIDIAVVGERVSDVVIRMFKPAAVTGHVFDEAGDPLVNHVVGIVQVSSDGRLLNGPTVRTDDRGEYRLATLTPGRYVVFVPQTTVSMPVSVGEEIAAGPPDPTVANRFRSAGAPSPSVGGIRVGESLVSTVSERGNWAANPLITNALPPTRNGNALLAYPTTFFPAAIRAAQATRIELASGDERTGVDLHLVPVPAGSVSGTVTDSSGPVANLGVHLLPGELSDDASILEVATTATDARGAFTMPAVPRGQYTLVAVRASNAPGLNAQQLQASRVADRSGAWAIQSIAIGDRPVEGVALAMRPPITVSGEVRFVGTSPPPSAERLRDGAFLTFWRARSLFRSPGGASGTTLDPANGGRFTIRGIAPPGLFGFGPSGIPAPWTLESITVGGRDVTDALVNVGEADIADVVITYTDRPASIVGNVTLAPGAADPGVSVFLLPADPARWRDARLSSRTFRVVRPPRSGVISLSNVIPGSYVVVAVLDAEAGDWPDERFLARLAAVGTRVTVKAGEPASVALKVSDLK